MQPERTEEDETRNIEFPCHSSYISENAARQDLLETDSPTELEYGDTYRGSQDKRVTPGSAHSITSFLVITFLTFTTLLFMLLSSYLHDIWIQVLDFFNIFDLII